MKILKILGSAFFLAMATMTSAVANEASEENSDTGTSDLILVVYQDPSCGCCGKWVKHMRDHGFTVKSVLESNMNARKQSLGVPPKLRSCHTAVIDDYVIEGHVPAADVKRLLKDRPEGEGLAVPGMPLGSPGMEFGERRQAYDVLLFDAAGDTAVFKHHPATP